jgi:hypothetical protein
MAATASDILATLYSMRSNPTYQQAEALRQKVGAANMAGAEKNSAEYGAVCFLIGTWETIAVLSLPLAKTQKARVFEVTPVAFMHALLGDAILAIRKVDKGPGVNYAINFQKLSDEQTDWLKTKPESYHTGEGGGMHALFG